MKLTSLGITTKDSSSKGYKLIQEINFYLEEEFITSYAALDLTYLRIDEDTRTIHIDEIKSYSYSNKKKTTERDEFKIFVSNKTLLRILMYASSEMKFDASLSDKDEIELIAELFNKLYKE